MENAYDRVYYIHDIECNQKYDKVLPYSFHLKCTLKQGQKYGPLCKVDINRKMAFGLIGHDLIEDARLTFNNIIDMLISFGWSSEYARQTADIIYSCTEEKGKNRTERHSEKFLIELSENRLGVFVKLCDIMANVLFSKLTNSTMLDKYRKEFPKLKEYLYVPSEYEILWNDLERELKN